ncbi:MAG: hypothetical protein HY689_03680, partial [Chloroflexi bacterium]|nr:hypothetical protein [Chloroflexota bacterium]
NLRSNRLETTAGRTAVRNGDFDISTLSRITPAYDPEDYNGQFYLPTAVENSPKWENARFMELFEQQRKELDQGKRGQMLREMSKLLYDDHVLLHGYNEALNPGWWNYVKGYVPPSDKLPHQTHYTHDLTWIDLDSPIRQK